MKILLLLTCSILLNISFAQKTIFPENFPKELIGKKICGKASTKGQMMGGQTAFLDFKYELFINQNDGIYLTYNPGEKFGDDRTGSTPKLQKFSFWKKEEKLDKYGDLSFTQYHYKVYSDPTSKHNITKFSVETNHTTNKTYISITFSVPSYEDATIATNFLNAASCKFCPVICE